MRLLVHAFSHQTNFDCCFPSTLYMPHDSITCSRSYSPSLSLHLSLHIFCQLSFSYTSDALRVLEEAAAAAASLHSKASTYIDPILPIWYVVFTYTYIYNFILTRSSIYSVFVLSCFFCVVFFHPTSSSSSFSSAPIPITHLCVLFIFYFFCSYNDKRLPNIVLRLI